MTTSLSDQKTQIAWASVYLAIVSLLSATSFLVARGMKTGGAELICSALILCVVLSVVVVPMMLVLSGEGVLRVLGRLLVAAKAACVLTAAVLVVLELFG